MNQRLTFAAEPFELEPEFDEYCLESEFDEEEVRKVLELYRGEEPLPEEFDQRSIADELVKRAKQLSSATVTFIEDTTRLERLGGVGGFLRYRISEEAAAPYEDSSSVPRAKALTTKGSS